MAWSPIGGGRLFSANSTEQSKRVTTVLARIAKGFGEKVTIDQIAYAWLLCHPSNILPVIGTNKCERIIALAQSLEIKLDRQQWFSIWQASAGTEVP